ncbi:MAG: VOC family protein [Candidatus Thorarchaeota archaeon]|jgi:predicted enzyme related to lactoylglutathione lyase
MKRVTGVGGVFFKSKDPEKLKEWYVKHLGLEPGPQGQIMFTWLERNKPEKLGHTIWSPFPEDTDYFEPSKASFMINYRVENLDAFLEQLKKEGVEVLDRRFEDEMIGKFGYVVDSEGNTIELWEPAKPTTES